MIMSKLQVLASVAWEVANESTSILHVHDPRWRIKKKWVEAGHGHWPLLYYYSREFWHTCMSVLNNNVHALRKGRLLFVMDNKLLCCAQPI